MKVNRSQNFERKKYKSAVLAQCKLYITIFEGRKLKIRGKMYFFVGLSIPK